MNLSHLDEISLQRRWDLTKVGWFFFMLMVFAGLFHPGRIDISFFSKFFRNYFVKKYNLSYKIKQYIYLKVVRSLNKKNTLKNK